MAEVIRPDFGGRQIPEFHQSIGETRDFKVGLIRFGGLPFGDEIRVMVISRTGHTKPTCVAAAIANPDGERAMEQAGDAVLAALLLAETPQPDAGPRTA